MACEVLSVKLDELDNEFEKMRHRIKLSREACHSRIREELVRLICGKDVGRVLTQFRDVFAEVMPPLAAM